MEDQDEICMCFHVTQRALRKFIRLEKPVRESQLSECFGAGTGCGWCRPYLKMIFEASQTDQAGQQIEISAEQYSEARSEYRKRESDSDRSKSDG